MNLLNVDLANNVYRTRPAVNRYVCGYCKGGVFLVCMVFVAGFLWAADYLITRGVAL